MDTPPLTTTPKVVDNVNAHPVDYVNVTPSHPVDSVNADTRGLGSAIAARP